MGIVNPGKELVIINLGGERLTTNSPKAKEFSLQRTDRILPHSVWGTPISGAPTFYTDMNKSGRPVLEQEIRIK